VRIEFTDEALADLESALDYLDERSHAAAANLGRRVIALVDQLATGEFEGPVTILSTGTAIRSWPVAPYRLYYQADGERLVVLRIYHQARRPL
jgi:plasmid stabilization system protein ParE